MKPTKNLERGRRKSSEERVNIKGVNLSTLYACM
jgi:hypothetical protein